MFEKGYSKHNIQELIAQEEAIKATAAALEKVWAPFSAIESEMEQSLHESRDFFHALANAVTIFKTDELRGIQPLKEWGRNDLGQRVRIAGKALASIESTGYFSGHKYDFEVQQDAALARDLLERSGLEDAFKNKNLAYDIATHDEKRAERKAEVRTANFATRARASQQPSDSLPAHLL